MHCSNCGANVASDAKFCPGCGKAVGNAGAATALDRSGQSKRGWVIAGVALAALILIMSQCDSETPPGNSGGASTEAVSAVPPTEVTAIELFDAYQANEARAQQQFGDRPLLVTAVLEKVDLDLTDDPTLLLRTSNEFMSAHAELVEEDYPKASGLNSGEPIRLLCEDLAEVMGTPMLRRCRIQPNG